MSEKRKDNKGRILKTGESQRKKLTYQYRYTDIRGRCRYVYAPTLDELRSKEKDIQKDLDAGIDYCRGCITLFELCKKYVSRRERAVRYNTTVGYNFVLNVLEREDFAYQMINKIKTSEAKDWIVSLHDNGYSYSTITTIRGVIYPALNTAVEDGVITRNPFSFRIADVVPNDSKKRKALTKEEQASWLDFLKSREDSSFYYYISRILIGTGLRISEMCGLTEKDIDFSQKRIRVERQLIRRTA